MKAELKSMGNLFPNAKLVKQNWQKRGKNQNETEKDLLMLFHLDFKKKKKIALE